MRISPFAASLFALFICGVLSPSDATTHNADDSVTVRMPGVKPTRRDTYLCARHPLPAKALQVIGYEPLAKMNTAHHMLLYSCTESALTLPAWNCGEMSGNGAAGDLPSGGICASGTKLIYAWAMNAPSLHLPPDVAFKIPSGDTLVLQVHYNDISKFVDSNETDDSGVQLLTSPKPLPKSAAVYLAGTGGQVPKYRVTYLETACEVKTKKKMYPFAFRTHTHKHGRVVAGYRVRGAEWTEIGRGNPRRPQMFYNVSAAPEKLALQNGDHLAARCTMYNRHNRDVWIGGTGDDEMCNFYMMYWVDGDIEDPTMQCWSSGYPHWSWSMFRVIDSDNSAPLKASVQPPLGEDEEEVVKDEAESGDDPVGLLPEDYTEFVIRDADGGRFYMDERTRAALALAAELDRQ